MSTLLFFYDNYYQAIQLDQLKSKTVTVGPDSSHTVTIQNLPFTNGSLLITEDSFGFTVKQHEKLLGKVNPKQFFEWQDENSNKKLKIILFLAVTNSNTYFIGNRQEILFSTKFEEADIFWEENYGNTQSFSLIRAEKKWLLEISNENHLYINGQRKFASKEIQIGDIIFTPFLIIRLLEEDVLEISSFENFDSTLSNIIEPASEMKKKYPIYRRTPRMVYELPSEKVTLSFPSQENDPSGRGLWIIILPPLVMLIVMGIVAVIQPRGIFILITMVMFVMTLITSSVQYFKDRSNEKRKKEKRIRVYTAYLENKRHELQELADKQKFTMEFHFPTFERMKYLTNQISDRIWERSVESEDFLQFRLGTGIVPSSFSISLNSNDMANREMDNLIEQSQKLEKVYKEIADMPVIANLAKGPIGLIGKDRVVKKEIQQLIGQLAFFHSYHDLRFIFIFDEEDYAQFEWMKWLPHFNIPNMYARGLIYNEKTRDQLLSSIYEMVRDRDLKEEKEQIQFTPHLVFIVTNQQLISDHVILEYLEGDHTHLNISVITATDAKESLSDNIYTLVRYLNDTEGDILIQNKKAVNIPFTLDSHQKENNERFSRMLRTLNHQTGMTNSIPDSVTFLEMMSVREVEELNIAHKWMENKSSQSLAVPIGLKGKDDLVYLNLHEKAHGPHGLLAGTTGSGKSEFLQSYILSLSVHFHPHEVAFLLIDYKGGGMAQPFKKLPHLLGTITNIEGSVNFTNRALASIRSELKRRQLLFDRYNVTHINDYTDLYKQQLAEEPLPHLFLISDEFAELKNEEPDFIRELVSAARIGRSLGVHLILATQKPGGVIDDQIWSNARFKIALKVQDATDSKEILKNTDAASITVTGRGYLQVGNNEVYDLFQSAWSGAPYLSEHSGGEDEIAIVTDLGLIPLSNIAAKENKQKSISEIEAVVSKIEETQNILGVKKLRSPWLSPLEDRIYNNTYNSEERYQIAIALVDEPEKQKQTPYYYQVMEDGNIGIFGSSGYGKSTTVLTLLLTIAQNYSPEEVHYYLMDFGNGSLLPLKQLPHTADFFLMEEKRKMEKFMRMIREEIIRRKQLLQQLEVGNIKLYNSVAEKKLPLIFVAVENFDFIKDEMPDFETNFNQFVRDGQSLGIYMIFTATRISAIRQAVMNNLKTKIVHYLMDHSEAYSVLGKTNLAPETIPGRAIIKKDEVHFSQIFLPANGANDFEMLEAVKETVKSLKAKYHEYAAPQPIPMLPNDLTLTKFSEYVRLEGQPQFLPIGLDEEFVQPVAINLLTNKHCLIIGQAQKGKTNVLKLLITTALQKGLGHIAVYDSFDRGLATLTENELVTQLEGKDQVEQWLSAIEEELAAREMTYTNTNFSDRSELNFEPILFVIDDFARFNAAMDTRLQEHIVKLMKNASYLGFNVIVTGNASDILKGYDSLSAEVKQIRQAVLLMKKSDQTLFTLPYDRKEEEIQAGFGYYVLNNKEIKIQLPLCDVERKIYS
ncbi:type VII secretion protein EssC [Solibacillus sp. FSL K6-4121]|uniref:type VII secretion protein EssC n=1 Tax=Solibacillus sp. FSL K6-4121 TaxID=2921505 RepID=UPI0030F6813A